MKRLIFLLVLLAAPLFAHAQASPPMCIPMVNGYPQGLPVVSESVRYCHAYWLCNTKGGEMGLVEGVSWPKRVSACGADAVLRAVWPKAMEVQVASATVGTAHRLWRENIAIDCYDKAALVKASTDTRRMCVERHARLKANKRTWWPTVTDWEK